ncbi:hypothetical protein BKA69DRAFT_707365 [Paraphysoderma sedebokerense]|nr:hypothetical protein BKA69DRAFT_707365 [Paraphysoderma sedebokerense]
MNIFSNHSGNICDVCPFGANCSVTGEREPIPANGFWKVPGRNDLYLKCDPVSYSSEFKFKLLRLISSCCVSLQVDSCPSLAGKLCGAGYKGIRCGECEFGYYRKNKQCLKCDGDSRSLLLIGGYVFTITLTIRFILVFLGNSSVGMFYIVVGFLQSLYVIGEININWPPMFKDFLQLIAVFTIKEEYLMPECFFNTLHYDGYHQKIWISWLIPFLLCVTSVFVVAFEAACENIRNSWKRRRGILEHTNSRNLFRHSNSRRLMISYRMGQIVLYLSYINIIRNAVSVFDCSTGLDGKPYLDSDLSVECYTEEWRKGIPSAIVGISLFVIGLPLYFSVLLYLKDRLRYNNNINLKTLCADVLILGHSYKDGAQYFIVLQLIMKIMLICSNIFFSGYVESSSGM